MSPIPDDPSPIPEGTGADPAQVGTVTDLLHRWRGGDDAALERLTPLVYDDFRRLARRQMAREGRRVTLQPTVLVHEAYLRLIDQRAVRWECRGHFFALAAQMIRRILVDHARKKAYAKRGGGWQEVSFDDPDLVARLGTVDKPEELVALDDALRELGEVDPIKARIVELRYFGGLQFNEIAPFLELSTATVNRRWRAARAWLFHYLEHQPT